MKNKFNVLKSNALKNPVYDRQSWMAIVPNDTRAEDVLRPGYWVHFARMLRPYAIIEVISEDCLLDMELRVVRVTEGLVYVRPLRVNDDKSARKIVEKSTVDTDTDAREPAPDGYKIKFTAGNQSYYVQLKETNTTLFKGLPNWDAAIEKAKDHAKKSASIAA
jgi:hypothetical protein